jgi:hypothetical protein
VLVSCNPWIWLVVVLAFGLTLVADDVEPLIQLHVDLVTVVEGHSPDCGTAAVR